MQLISDIQEARALCQQWRDKGESIAFVPTMGCLHEGHLSLVRKAKSCAEHVVVSIFVNPLQFGENEDFSTYPRTLDEDSQKLAEFTPDFIFVPEVKSFYPEGKDAVSQIDVGEITCLLEGANRPGHFAGVATVVKRLFEVIQPDIAIFGEKDFQQLMVIKQLVKKFSLNIEIIGMPTYRENDGLAMSSRNTYLSKAERREAPQIYQSLEYIKAALLAGRDDYSNLENEAKEKLEKMGFIPDYVVIRDSETLLEPQGPEANRVILAAARLGQTRLIDNLRV